MSKKNSLEAKKARREQKVRARNYPNFYTLVETRSRAGIKYSKLVKTDKSPLLRDPAKILMRGKLEPR